MLALFSNRSARKEMDVLSPQELSAVFHHLRNTVEEFKAGVCQLPEHALREFLRLQTNVAEVKVPIEEERKRNDDSLYLYKREVPTDYFTLILDGQIEVSAARQGFKVNLHRWHCLCPDILLFKDLQINDATSPLEPYVPDFSAKVIETARILRISRTKFRAAIVTARASLPGTDWMEVRLGSVNDGILERPSSIESSLSPLLTDQMLGLTSSSESTDEMLGLTSSSECLTSSGPPTPTSTDPDVRFHTRR
eukprot:gb/GEZN01013033.1/.p1 GENE.gb/GEZN01013033.1/~~gb/GEZN01013033.1/.p1  ORF type:complete len:278 (-),score=47.11 gb/GEZN01013033.1/:207-959(-)